MRVLLCKIHCPLICFCNPSHHLYNPSPLKLENTPHVPSKLVSVSDTSGETIEVKEDNLDGKQEQKPETLPKSNLKMSRPMQTGSPQEVEKKRVQWMDFLGKELVEVKEFESSESGDTDTEDDNRGCVCVIL